MKTLNDNIQDIIQEFRDVLPAEVNNLIEQGAGEISSLPIIEHAKKIGVTVKDFTLPNRNEEQKSLSKYLTKGPVVITFYRGVWCPYCNLQLKTYNDILPQIKALGANLIALTPEGKDGLSALEDSKMPQESKDTVIKEVNFDILHDYKSKIANEFGLVFNLPQAHLDLLKMMEYDLEKANDEDSFMFADPATYIVNKDGVIVWSFIPNNYRKRAEPQAILDELKKLMA